LSVASFAAVAFLVAVLISAEFVWLREESREKARSLGSDHAKGRPAPQPLPSTFTTQWAAPASERSA
jgi:hypothetical protein